MSCCGGPVSTEGRCGWCGEADTSYCPADGKCEADWIDRPTYSLEPEFKAITVILVRWVCECGHQAQISSLDSEQAVGRLKTGKSCVATCRQCGAITTVRQSMLKKPTLRERLAVKDAKKAIDRLARARK